MMTQAIGSSLPQERAEFMISDWLSSIFFFFFFVSIQEANQQMGILIFIFTSYNYLLQITSLLSSSPLSA